MCMQYPMFQTGPQVSPSSALMSTAPPRDCRTNSPLECRRNWGQSRVMGVFSRGSHERPLSFDRAFHMKGDRTLRMKIRRSPFANSAADPSLVSRWVVSTGTGADQVAPSSSERSTKVWLVRCSAEVYSVFPAYGVNRSAPSDSLRNPKYTKNAP